MTPSEEYFLKVRNKLDDLGYLQPLSFESVMLVDKLLDDFLETKKNLQHYKNVAQQSMEACSELQVGVGPYKEDNARLVRENNNLRQKLLKAREAIEDTKVDPSRKKDSSKVDKDLMLDKAQDKINSLIKEITNLKSEQQELDEVIECLKNKVNARDTEIERLNGLLADGRPLMSRNQCQCCSPQLLDCRLLAKNKELSDQLEESKQKQHEAMVRAMELAERNQVLETRNMNSARSTNTSQGSKRCCCAENANKICKLQEKLEDRILQVEKLEVELIELRKAHTELRADKLSVDKILELTLEDKKKLNDRVNELSIIEHDLMLEIEHLKRTNASQKSQLAELEAQIRQLEQETRPSNPTKTHERPTTAKASYGTSRTQEHRRPTQPIQKKVTISKPTPVPPKPSFKPPPPKKPSSRAPETTTDTSSLSPRGSRRAAPPPSTSTSPSPPPDLRDQLIRERRQFQQQLEEMERQQAEHCAKFHPPACPRSSSEPINNKEADSQWLLLERVQAERDYYHKEFSRLRDQLCNIPDHSAEASAGPSSPHQKLERLLTERDYYHKEMCRLLELLSKSQAHQSAVSDRRPLCCKKNNCFCIS